MDRLQRGRVVTAVRGWAAAAAAIAVALAGCSPAVIVVTATPSPTIAPIDTATPPPPTVTPTATLTPTPYLTPTPPPPGLWVAPGVPDAVRAAVEAALAGWPYRTVENPKAADLRVDMDGDGAPLMARWVYAVVAPFPTLADAMAWDDALRFWEGQPEALAYITNSGVIPTLFLTGDTLATLTALLGPPHPNTPVQVVGDAVHLAAWEQCHAAWSIVPFDTLRPEWKVLAVDGVNVLERGADLSGYPLAVDVGVHGSAALLGMVMGGLGAPTAGVFTNRDPARMTTLAMTGVTALARATAWRMDSVDMYYPARDILPVLQGADILHISNEVAFSPDCQPDPSPTSMRFCARESYLELLVHIGVDVVELTGNHLNDWGVAAFSHTLDLYEDVGMGVFGGGRDLEAAQMPYITAHNGNTFAFVGCNPVGPPAAFATESSPGAAPCDYAALREQVGALAEQVDVVVVTQQYWEYDHAEPTAQQVADFEALARAGADIVSGSQAHRPQGFAFVGETFVHYGLGNLFFDQMQSIYLREMFVDLHVIYEGRHISTALFTGVIEDYARPRPMTVDERRDFLRRIFDAPSLCP